MNRDLAASIRDRLKARADAAREDFNLTLNRYGLERVLYRLSISPHADRFLLKGALLFSLWYDRPHRPTRDADLLAYGPSDTDDLLSTFREICALRCDDGLELDPMMITATPIRKSAGYGGVRVDIPAVLSRARLQLQVDVGFGDAVTPAALAVDFPVLLQNLPAPRLRAYPKHTVVAEKLHAVWSLGLSNTRMKDFFDLDVLLADGEIVSQDLRRAVLATFERRGMAPPDSMPVGLSDDFAMNAARQAQWNAFLRRSGIEKLPLAPLVERIREALRAHGILQTSTPVAPAPPITPPAASAARTSASASRASRRAPG